MDEKIETTSAEIYPRQPVQIRAPFSRKLKLMSEEQHRSMSNLVEFWIEQEWQRTRHIQEPTIEKDLERRR